MKNVSENEDQQWDSEYKIKSKKGKFYINKKRRKQNDKRKYEKTNVRKNYSKKKIYFCLISLLYSYRKIVTV